MSIHPIAEAVPELDTAVEMLEAYPTYCTDYPDANGTAFQGIKITTNSGTPNLNWTAHNRVTDCGQHAVVISNANPGGEVDVWYVSPFISVYPNPIEQAGTYDFALNGRGPTTLQWSYDGMQLGTANPQPLYVDAASRDSAIQVTMAQGPLHGTASLAIPWNPITSVTLNLYYGCEWIGGPNGPDGYSGGGAPPYYYQWVTSDWQGGDLTDTTNNTQDTVGYYDPYSPTTFTMTLTVSDAGGSSADTSITVSGYDCPGKLPRQVDTSDVDSRMLVGLGRKVSGGTRPRLSWGRWVL